MKRRTQGKVAESRRLLTSTNDAVHASGLAPGYDYVAALHELNARYSYEEIAEHCDYEGKASVQRIASGKMIPSHPKGERIYILYFTTFGRKPPNKPYPFPKVNRKA